MRRKCFGGTRHLLYCTSLFECFWLCLQHTAFILESQDNFGPKVLIGSLTFSSDPVQEMGIGSRNSLTDILTGKEFAVSTVWEDAKGGAIMQPITGQYECVHSSGMGLDYFTSRIDRLILHSDGRFILTVQQRSRVTHAAHLLMSGGQVSAIAPETRLEGFYVCQDHVISLRFDNGGLEEAQISPNGDGLQIGPNFFTKVSDFDPASSYPSSQTGYGGHCQRYQNC